MMTLSAASLVFFHLLADRDGRPAALLLDVQAGLCCAPSPAEQGWSELARRCPCFYPDHTAPALAAALQVHGWRALAHDQLWRTDRAFGPEPAPAIRWIGGHWSLLPPSKAPGNHAASRVLALQLVQLVAADGDTHEIETLLRRDPRLSYHLLRLVNSPGMGGGRRVTSFAQAILILGRQQLRRWLNLMLFAARDGDIRSGMLLARVAVRARAMELLAKSCGLDKMSQEHAFMSGLFSLLGILFGTPLAELLQPLTMCDAVQRALLQHDGDLGALLALVVAAEQGRFDDAMEHLQALQLPALEFNRVMREAHLWMLGVLNETADPAHA